MAQNQDEANSIKQSQCKVIGVIGYSAPGFQSHGKHIAYSAYSVTIQCTCPQQIKDTDHIPI
jgi:hypothetical protein